MYEMYWVVLIGLDGIQDIMEISIQRGGVQRRGDHLRHTGEWECLDKPDFNQNRFQALSFSPIFETEVPAGHHAKLSSFPEGHVYTEDSKSELRQGSSVDKIGIIGGWYLLPTPNL